MTKRFDRPIEYRAINIAETDLPHDDAAEEELIAACFASTPLLDSVADLVLQREFYGDARGRVFASMQSLRVEGKSVTLGTVIARLRERDEVIAIGGLEVVTAMATRASSPDPELVREYAVAIRHAAHRREIAKALQVQLGEAYSGRTEHVKFVEGVESAVFNATRGIETVEEGVGLDVLVEREEERLREIEQGRVSSGGIPFGFGALDDKLGGGAPGQTTIVCGRPGMGKSALLANLATNVAASNHDGIARGVLVFCLEMTKEEWLHRMVASEGNVNLRRVIAGKLTGLEAEAAWKARAMLARLPLVIDDAIGLTPSRLRSRLRRAMMRFNNERQQIALVAIDSLQWMRPDREYGTSTGDRSRELGDILKAVVETAKETKVHHAVAAQLNRDVGKRTGKELRPRLTDLAESGDVEKHAHNVIGVHRPEYYDMDKDALSDEQKRLAEVCVLKQRNGDTGLVALDYVRECTRFQARGGSHVSRL